MARRLINPMEMLRGQARRLLPALALGLVGLQAQASCAMAGELDPARADASWVMHADHGATSGGMDHSGHGSHAGHGSEAPADPGCPGCDHPGECGDGDCLQVVEDAPEAAGTKGASADPLTVLPSTIGPVAPATTVVSTPATWASLPVPERSAVLRFVRFLE